MPTPQTLEQVFTRARNYLNDAAGQIWSDSALSVMAQDAYDWLYNEISRHCEAPFEKVSRDIPYVPSIASGKTEDITRLMPADMLFPEMIDWRQSVDEDWTPVDRVGVLPTGWENNPSIAMAVWEYTDRRVKVIAPQNTGFLRVRYAALVPPISEGTDILMMDNAVGALSHYLAFLAFSRRGQVQQAAIEMGKEYPPSGALGFAFQVTSLIVKNQQHLPRRMVRYTHGGMDDSLTRYGTTG